MRGSALDSHRTGARNNPPLDLQKGISIQKGIDPSTGPLL